MPIIYHRVLPVAGLVVAFWVLPDIALGQGSASTTGVSTTSNPAISVNALFLGARTSDELSSELSSGLLSGLSSELSSGPEGEHGHDAGNSTGLRVQELEVQFTSFVDPYWKAEVILALPGGDGVEVEEGYVTSLGLPGDVQLKVGKFYAELGRQNLLHTHAYALIDAPQAHQHLLGDEGLNEAGLSLSWLSPMPWFMEVTGQVLDGVNERFDSDAGADLLYVGHVKSFHELGDATTVEVGASRGTGANHDGHVSTIVGGDLTIKWQPPHAATRRALIWQSEYLRASDDGPGNTAEGGLYSQVQYQLARRWWVTSRLDLMGLPGHGADRDWGASALLALVPSEFSSVRLQYSHLRAEGETSHRLLMQLNVTIGSHPAHRY